MHTLLNPDDLAPAIGFSHVAVAAPGRHVYVAGQTAHQPDGSIRGESIAEQFAAAAANIATALSAADAETDHIVSLMIYVTDVEEYLAQLKPIGEAYRTAFGRHYPPMALLGVTRLFDEEAKVELVATAVVPDESR